VGADRVGVFPAAALDDRPRLFGALALAFACEFLPMRGDGDPGGVDAIVAFGPVEPAGAVARVPVLRLPHQPDVRHAPGVIRFADTPHLDRWLRDRTMEDERAAALPGLGPDGAGEVIATGPAGPVWRTVPAEGPLVQEACACPAELRPGERLKDRLRAGAFFSLLPLVQLLRDLSGQAWQRPPARASFIFDDANLHSTSYGFIDYPALATHARRHGYHAAIATIPLDARFARADAVDCFRPAAPLSLLVHGNNHTRRELDDSGDEEHAARVVATVVRRVHALEARTGLRVARVMSPPHAQISETVMAALLAAGFEATCYWGTTDGDARALDGWHPADLHLGGGLPGTHRLFLDASADEMALRLFLDQPLLLSGHHTDLRQGLDLLGDCVRRVNALGDIRWPPLVDLLRQSLRWRRDGDALRVVPFTRRLRLDLPPGVSRLSVEWPGGRADDPRVAVSRSGAPVDGLGADGGSVDVDLMPPAPSDAPGAQPLPLRPWPVVRRCMTEGRDRLMPLIRLGGH
jgi:hypothetical protein